VFQSFHLVPSLNAVENVMLPLELAGHPNARQAALEIVREVGLAERQSHYPAQLSGGEKQRVAIARAFATQPAVLFADEPTGNLDARTGEKIMQLMFDLNHDSATTLVLVTHDVDLAGRCDRILTLEAGRLVGDARAAA
jgi:putative ABC transport system ATP-binding protein